MRSGGAKVAVVALASLAAALVAIEGRVGAAPNCPRSPRHPESCSTLRVPPARAPSVLGRPRRDTRESTARLRLLGDTLCPRARVLLDDVKASRGGLARGSAAADTCIAAGDETLFSAYDGEYGGVIEATSARGSRVVFDEPVESFAVTSAGVFAIGGRDTSGGATPTGYLAEVRTEARGATITAVLRLPEKPNGFAVATDGTLLLAYARAWSTTSTGMAHDLGEKVIALDDDGSAYELACEAGSRGRRLAIAWGTAPRPHAPLPQPAAPLTQAQLECVVTGYRPQLRHACGAPDGSSDGDKRSRATIVVFPSGKVAKVTTTGNDAALNACLEAQMSTWLFPAAGTTSTFDVPVVFRTDTSSPITCP